VRRRLVVTVLSLAVFMAATSAAHAAAVQPFRFNDAGGFNDVLPPGTNGSANLTQLAAFLGSGARPAHNNDQLAMYNDLVFATPGLQAADLRKYFKDSSFGVRPEDVERTYSPCPNVTILRDKQFGVPHVYGDTREGTMCGLGYIAGEDRMFFIDVLRNLGRAQVSSFAGGAPGNRAFDQSQWAVAPYTEADLQRQFDQGDDLYGAEGIQVQQDAVNYVRGVNTYINQLNPLTMPGEYAAIQQPTGPKPWKVTDIIATAALVGGIFGKGGGGEVSSALRLQKFQQRYGRRLGARLWRQFAFNNDPEAPTTVFAPKRFPYQLTPRRVTPGSAAIPDLNSVAGVPIVKSGVDARSSSRNALAGPPEPHGGLLGSFPSANSNALVVSGSESDSGRPLAVFGPQTGYFAPQILMEQDVHGPGIDARGAAFPGVNLYVQLGRGRDYVWSATSAGNDIIDTFAVDLCEPGGGTPTKGSMHYMFRGACTPMESLERTNTWAPTPADSTPAGSQTLQTLRTKLGLVRSRATIAGRPVAFTELRSTYFHEVDSAGGFSDFNNPDKMRNAQDFQRAASRIGYTFNWLYADDRDIAYFNSGNNPSRPAGLDPLLPTRAKFEWRGFNPDNNTATYTPFASHPQVVNQQFLTSWNNKQAPGSGNTGYGPLYRSLPLDDRIRRGIQGANKMSLVELIDAAEDAGTVDLRGDKVLPHALAVIGRQRDPRLAGAIATLTAWNRSGAHRRDRDNSGTYEDAEAVRIMDAWWPRLVKSVFEPTMGPALFDAAIGEDIDNAPNNHGDHLGSAYQDGAYSAVQKDLRTIARRRVRGRFARVFCGGGNFLRCRAALVASLQAALGVSAAELYRTGGCADGDQRCYDEVRFRALGGVTQKPIHWINRPTYQQAAEIQGHRPR